MAHAEPELADVEVPARAVHEDLVGPRRELRARAVDQMPDVIEALGVREEDAAHREGAETELLLSEGDTRPPHGLAEMEKAHLHRDDHDVAGHEGIELGVDLFSLLRKLEALGADVSLGVVDELLVGSRHHVQQFVHGQVVHRPIGELLLGLSRRCDASGCRRLQDDREAIHILRQNDPAPVRLGSRAIAALRLLDGRWRSVELRHDLTHVRDVEARELRDEDRRLLRDRLHLPARRVREGRGDLLVLEGVSLAGQLSEGVLAASTMTFAIIPSRMMARARSPSSPLASRTRSSSRPSPLLISERRAMWLTSFIAVRLTLDRKHCGHWAYLLLKTAFYSSDRGLQEAVFNRNLSIEEHYGIAYFSAKVNLDGFLRLKQEEFYKNALLSQKPSRLVSILSPITQTRLAKDI